MTVYKKSNPKNSLQQGAKPSKSINRVVLFHTNPPKQPIGSPTELVCKDEIRPRPASINHN
jgi:hypothetical protein